ncbi:MAG: type II secretion system F family protein [Bryobacteraceae bacterium]|nr:type II secretion system F family protein [Bryobacteraceae bacterium]MDW8377093.1 type II secretion system F family protein [Bryobacterales bacterium]
MTGTTLLLAGFFFSVLGAVCALGYWWTRRQAAMQQLSSLAPVLEDLSPELSLRASLLGLLSWLGEWMPSSPASRAALQKRLRYAGYRAPSAHKLYFGLKCASALLLGLILAILAVIFNDGAWFSALVCGLGLGFLIPERVLNALIQARSERLRRALPPALDLMVMSLEGGQSLDQALLAASRGIRTLLPDLAEEFMQTHLEARLAGGRAEAIQNMAERNCEPELQKLCQLMIDADRFGSSLAPTLRQHSKFLRIRFRQKAQESARKLTVKLVFPLFFLIFPAILVVTLGPAVLAFRKFFASGGF